MDKVMYYNIAGVGNIFALELGQYETNTKISWPAVGINMPHPDPAEAQRGRIVLQMTNFVPEFLEDVGEANKELSIPNNLIVIRAPVNSNIEKVYLEWQRKSQTKATGIVIPEIRQGGLIQ